MNNLQMQRYQIAQDRGFKGSFREFCKQDRTEVFTETPKWKKKRRGKALEEHVVAILGGPGRDDG